MLDILKPLRFDGKVSSGKTEPYFMSAVDAEGQEHEVVVKLSIRCTRKESDLVIEALAALLAVDLGLPVPQPFLLRMDDDFATQVVALSDKEAAQRIKASSPIAFASKKLPPGFMLWTHEKRITKDLLPQAQDIFAFDSIIVNSDRRPENPNCLCNGRNFAIIDHELAFQQALVLFWQPPWQLGSLDANKTRHAFFSSLIGKALPVTLGDAWAKITPDRLQAYLNALPPEWLGSAATAKDIAEYLLQVSTRLDDIQTEIRRALA